MSLHRPWATSVTLSRGMEPTAEPSEAQKFYADQQKTRAWLGCVITDTGQVFEVRIMTKRPDGSVGGPVYAAWFYGNDLDRAAQVIVAAARRDTPERVLGVFLIPNPIDPVKAGVVSFGRLKRRSSTTKDDAIRCRH